jgi:hypothetical protein
MIARPAAAIQRVDQAGFAAGFAAALHRGYGARVGKLKLIANDAGANERAAKNWLNGKNAPDAVHLLRLATFGHPEVAAFLREICAVEEAGEDGGRQLALFANAWVRP